MSTYAAILVLPHISFSYILLLNNNSGTLYLVPDLNVSLLGTVFAVFSSRDSLSRTLSSFSLHCFCLLFFFSRMRV